MLADNPHERLLGGLHRQLAEKPAVYQRERREPIFNASFSSRR
jgi:hypothetical protein